jgi:putative hydrolase of the HAD superfamily
MLDDPMVPLRRQDLDAVFLDAGNTLVSIDHDLVCEVLASEGVAATAKSLERAEAAARPAVSRFLGDGGSTERADAFTFYVERMLEQLGVDGPGTSGLVARLVTTLKRDFSTQRLWSRVLPGVPDALASLRDAGLRLIVVSNSDGTVESGLAAVGLRPLVDAVVDSAVVGAEKPDPAIFRHALRLADAPAARVAHVGDLYAVDVLGARAAGLHAVLLDPYGDWDGADCFRAADLPRLARALLRT